MFLNPDIRISSTFSGLCVLNTVMTRAIKAHSWPSRTLPRRLLRMRHLLLLLILASQETCCGLPADTLFVSTSTFSPGRAGTFDARPPLTVPANAGGTSAASEPAGEVSDTEQAACEHEVEHVSLGNAPVQTSDWLRGDVVGGYSAIIDVRSPSEYQDDHIPGSINLPVLSDEQRHEVGSFFKSWAIDLWLMRILRQESYIEIITSPVGGWEPASSRTT